MNTKGIAPLQSIKDRFQELEESIIEEELEEASLDQYREVVSILINIFEKIPEISRPVIGMTDWGMLVFEWKYMMLILHVWNKKTEGHFFVNGRTVATFEIPDISDKKAERFFMMILKEYGREGDNY